MNDPLKVSTQLSSTSHVIIFLTYFEVTKLGSDQINDLEADFILHVTVGIGVGYNKVKKITLIVFFSHRPYFPSLYCV